MVYTIDNGTLRVSAKSMGAELCGALHIPTGEEMVWQPHGDWWPRQAPLLFPHCGSVAGDRMLIDGREYPSPRHGFIRDCEFSAVRCDESEMVLRFESDAATREKYPFDFAITVTYTLEGNILLQKVEVANTGGEALPFNFGFHPAFAVPFGPGKATADYEFAFDVPETPIVCEMTGQGLDSGDTRPLFQNGTAIPLTDDLFKDDSICMKDLKSAYLTLREKANPGRNVRVGIEEFPYVLVWGPPHGPLPFVCIEPWHGIPDPAGYAGDFRQKPGVQTLQPGESFATTLSMEFNR